MRGLNTGNFRLLTGKEVCLFDLVGAAKLDKKYYSDTFKPTFSQWFWSFRNDEIYDIILERGTNKVVAYSLLMPLSERAYQEIMNGNFIDTHIKLSDIGRLGKPGKYHLYVGSVIIDEEYRSNHSLCLMLYKAYFNKILSWHKRGIEIIDIFADIVSDEGASIASHLRMKKIKETSHGSSLYLGPAPDSAKP